MQHSPPAALGAAGDTLGFDAPTDALGDVWERIVQRIEELLAPAETLTASLLEAEPDSYAVGPAVAGLDTLAGWIGDLGMVAAARLARSLRRHLAECGDRPVDQRNHPADVASAVTAAGMIEDLRSSIDTTGAGGVAAGVVGDVVLVVGAPGPAVDSMIWFGATSGFVAHHAHHLEGWPTTVDAVLIVDESSGSPTNLLLACRLARERFATVPLVCVTARPSPRDRADIARHATSLLSTSLRPVEVFDELRRHLHLSRRIDVIAVRGDEADEVVSTVQGRGLEAWTSDDDLDLLAGLEGGRATGVMLLPSDDNGAFVRLLRAQPGTRRLVIVEVLENEDVASHAGVDATIEGLGVIGPRVDQLAELLRQRSDFDVDVAATARTGGVPWSSAAFLAERVLLAAHRADSVASLCVIRYDPLESVGQIDALQEELMREFRTDDVVTRSADRENILVLGGVDRQVSQSRLQGIVERSGITGSRVGIAEFPYDAQSVDELVAASRTVLDRSAGSGLRVVTADWHADRSAPADIVVADSDPASARVVAHAMERSGFAVEHISDGQLLLERLQNPMLEPPRLLVLDFDLLSVDGLTILRRLHRQGAVRRFDVVMLSSRTREADIRQAYDLGVVEVIEKPFSPGIVARRLLRLVAANA